MGLVESGNVSLDGDRRMSCVVFFWEGGGILRFPADLFVFSSVFFVFISVIGFTILVSLISLILYINIITAHSPIQSNSRDRIHRLARARRQIHPYVPCIGVH